MLRELGPGEARTICTACHVVPKQGAVVWDDTEKRLMHVATTGKDQDGRRRVCGGTVVAEGLAWERDLLPGSIQPCAGPRGFIIHHVRLGRKRHARSGGFSGTALCGAAPDPGQHWRPIEPQLVQKDNVCTSCARRAASQGE